MPNILEQAKDVLGHIFRPQKTRQGSEQPKSTLVSSDGDYEIRDYPAMLMAEVTVQGEREDAASTAFGHLYRFITAEDRDGEEIKMTTPVFEIPRYGPITEEALDRESGELTVRFMMPHRWTEATLPKPTDPKVRIVTSEPMRAAVIRFSGTANDEQLEEHTAKLRRWMDEHSHQPAGDALFALYDPPFTPPPRRRNEVLIPISA